MPRTSPYRIESTKDERNRLEASARRHASAHRDATRAKIVLLAAEGLPNDEIAARPGTPRQESSPSGVSGSTSNAWPGSGSEHEPDGPRSSPPEVVVAIKALACELPATNGVPLARWHAPDLLRAAIEQGTRASISDTTIWRWLSADAIRPWQSTEVGSSLAIPTSPRRPAGCSTSTIGAPSMANRSASATSSSAPTKRPASKHVCASTQQHRRLAGKRCASSTRVRTRRGAGLLLAARDAHRAKLFGRFREPSTGIEPFGRPVERVMGAEPYASAERVFWISWTTAVAIADGPPSTGCGELGRTWCSSTFR